MAKAKKGSPIEQQLQHIGVAPSVPQTIMNLIDQDRLMLSKVQAELMKESLVLTEKTKFGYKDYINPKFIIAEKLTYMINHTTRNAVEIAQIINKNNMRPIETGLNQPSGVEIEYTKYSADDQPEEEEKPLSPKQQVDLLKEVKRREMKGGKRGNSN